MNKFLFFLCGLTTGAIVGVLMAPRPGREIRANIKDKSVKYSKDVGGFASDKAKLVADKAKGYAHSVKGAIGSIRGEDKEVQSYI